MDTQTNILDIDIEDKAKSETAGVKLYSPSAIFGFAFFFSTIAGGVMLVMNLKALNKKEGILPILAFVLLYPVAFIAITWDINIPAGISTGLNVAAAYFMKEFFWSKYLGKETQYEKRSIWIPLVICIGVMTLLIIGLFQYLDGAL